MNSGRFLSKIRSNPKIFLAIIAVGVTLVTILWIGYMVWGPTLALTESQQMALSQLVSQLEAGLSAFVLFFLGLAVTGRQQLRAGSLVTTYDLLIMVLSLLLLTAVIGAFASFGYIIAQSVILLHLSIALLFIQGLTLSAIVLIIINLAIP